MTSQEDHKAPNNPGTSAGAAQETEAGSRPSGRTNGSKTHDNGPAPEEKGDRSSASRNPVSRLADESRALFDDLREWVDLRVQLVQVDVEERIEKAANEIIAIIMVAVLGLFALAFLLHGVAIWLGDVLGGTQWGYLIVAAVLGIVTFALKSARPDFVSRRGSKEQAGLDRLPEPLPEVAELPAAASSRQGDTSSSTNAEETKEGGENG